jgi:ADP-ribosyl-[dinitrogen reductase] hydrolase
MALCLANSLVARQDFVPYDQLVRYKWWNINGYMSSTGKCFDIGAATKQSVDEFSRRQKQFAKENNIEITQLDFLSDKNLLEKFDTMCSEKDVAGNGALMRLTPVPLFFYKYPKEAVEFSGISGQITHGDQKAYDACRYYGALIIAALHGEKKDQLIDKNFYAKHKHWFNGKTLHPDIIQIAEGSYQKKGGYDDGIRGPGYIVKALEAALWAFWSDGDSFKKGALAAVNLGDDTDTTAAIYGQLAGACYGYKNLPPEWIGQVYAKKFIEILSKWMAYEGQRWQPEKAPQSSPSSTLQRNILYDAVPPSSTPTTKSDPKTTVSATFSATGSSGGIFHSPLSLDNHSGTITSSTVPTTRHYGTAIVSDYSWSSPPDVPVSSTLPTKSCSVTITPATSSPQHYSHTIPSSTQSSQSYSGMMSPSSHKNLYSPSTDTQNEVYTNSSTYFDRISRNEPSHEFEYDRHSQMSHPTSTNKEFESTSRTTEFRNYNADMSNVGNTAVGTQFPRESNLDYRLTNKRKCR